MGAEGRGEEVGQRGGAGRQGGGLTLTRTAKKRLALSSCTRLDAMRRSLQWSACFCKASGSTPGGSLYPGGSTVGGRWRVLGGGRHGALAQARCRAKASCCPAPGPRAAGPSLRLGLS